MRGQVDDAYEVGLGADRDLQHEQGRADRFSIMSTQRWNSAPVRSSLLTKHMRGTRYLSACRQTVSDWGSTPATPSNTGGAVEDPQRALDLDGEVDVSGGVDDVDRAGLSTSRSWRPT